MRTAKRGVVFSPNRERRQRFCDEMAEVAGFELRPAESPEEVAREADVLLVATYTRQGGPALSGSWLHSGMHVSSIGSTLPVQREIDEQTWAVADLIVLDTPALLEESGDAIAARAAGTIEDGKVVQLYDIVAGRVAGRRDASETTLYKSVGTPAPGHCHGRVRVRGSATERCRLRDRRLPVAEGAGAVANVQGLTALAHRT